MTRQANRVYTDPGEIARLAALCAQLDDTERVAMLIVDASRLEGTVVVRPILQTFFDADGNEGTNAVLRLDDVEARGETRWVWIDEVLDVVPLVTPEPSANQGTRTTRTTT